MSKSKLKRSEVKYFWSLVNKHSGVYRIVNGRRSQCWIFEGYTTPKQGYGYIRLDGKQQLVHRVSLAIDKGIEELPKDVLSCHHCDNPPCVRPKHLFEGTYKSNTEDRDKKGRTSRGEKHWRTAKLTERKVRRIRRLRSRGKSLRAIGHLFGVSNVTVHAITTGKTWKHVKVEEEKL